MFDWFDCLLQPFDFITFSIEVPKSFIVVFLWFSGGMRGRWASTGRATRPTRCSNWCRPSARRRCRRSTGWASSTTSSHWSRPATRPPSTLSSCSRYQTHPWFASLSSVSLGLKEFSTNTIFIYLVFVQPSFLPWNRSFHRNGPFFVSTLCYPQVRVFICALLQVLALTVWIFLVKCVRHKCMSNYLHSMVDLKKSRTKFRQGSWEGYFGARRKLTGWSTR